jgi:hypothetical protein
MPVFPENELGTLTDYLPEDLRLLLEDMVAKLDGDTVVPSEQRVFFHTRIALGRGRRWRSRCRAAPASHAWRRAR